MCNCANGIITFVSADNVEALQINNDGVVIANNVSSHGFIGMGSGITDINGGNIQSGTIHSNQIATVTDDAYRNINEVDPYSIHVGGVYESYTSAGGTYTATGEVVCTSGLLTNGVESIDYDLSGAGLFIFKQISTNGSDWTTFTSIAADPSYIRLITVDGMPVPGSTVSVNISNIVVTSFDTPALVGTTNDVAGQVFRVSDPVNPRDIVNKRYLDAEVTANDPVDWSDYPAISDVYLGTNALIMGKGWSVAISNSMGTLSYTSIAADGGMMQISHNGTPMITADSGLGGLAISGYDMSNTTVYAFYVATNGVVSTPIIEHTDNLQLPNWQIVAAFSNRYPSVNTATNYDVVVNVPATGFYRAIQQLNVSTLGLRGVVSCNGGGITNLVFAYPQLSTNNTPTLYTPRRIGDELVIHTTTNIVYRSFGLTTNDWEVR